MLVHRSPESLNRHTPAPLRSGLGRGRRISRLDLHDLQAKNSQLVLSRLSLILLEAFTLRSPN